MRSPANFRHRLRHASSMMGPQIAKYALIQILAYLMDYGIFITLTYFFGAPPLQSNVAGKIISGVFSYFSHRHFTFSREEKENVWFEAIRYFTVLGLNVPISSGLLAIFCQFLPVLIAKFISDALCVALSFKLTQLIVFRQKQPTGGRSS
jgi:putative flippase GtrA